MAPWLPVCVCGILLTAYLCLFLAGRGAAALRMRRLGSLLAVLTGLRLAAVWMGLSWAGQWEWATFAFMLAAGAGLLLAGRVWIVRAPLDVLRDQVREARGRLFLTCDESSSQYWTLTCKQRTCHIRYRRLGARFSMVLMPPGSGHDKVTLLVDWLAKQYPGPIPRIHIVLKENSS